MEELQNEAADERDDFEPWCGADLVAPPDLDGLPLGDSFMQVASAGMMIGDVGAVAVVQAAHSRLLLAHRVLEPLELLVGGSFPRRRCWATCTLTT